MVKFTAQYGYVKMKLTHTTPADCRNQSVQISGGQAGDQQHRQYKHRRGKSVTGICHLQQNTQLCCAQQNDTGDQQVPPGKGKPGGQFEFRLFGMHV